MKTIDKVPRKKPEKIEHPLTQRSRFGWIPIVAIGTIVLNLGVTFALVKKVDSIALERSDIYLQKVDGSIEVGESKPSFYRSEEVVQTFVEEWLILAYTWNSNDPKMFVRERKVNYPLALHSASMAIHPEYREAYLSSVAKKYRNRFAFQSYIAGENQSHIRVFKKPVIEELGEGEWKATIIAYRTHTKKGSVIAEEKFNHVFRIRAIKGVNPQLKSERDTFLQKVMKVMQDKKLQIIEIGQF